MSNPDGPERYPRVQRRTPETASFEGAAGAETADNLVRLALGRTTVESLGDAYFTSESGEIGIIVDAATFNKLP